MQIGELLVGLGLTTPAQIDEAVRRQSAYGGRLGENLIELGIINSEQLASVLNRAPSVPSNIADTGILPRNLLNLMLKLMFIEALETVGELSQRMKLPQRIVQSLMDDAARQHLLQALGSAKGASVFSIRYALGDQGKAAARDALEQNLYLGPAPVCLSAYQQQILAQRITNELVREETMRRCFAGLVVPDYCLERLLPAVNAGRTVLLFGPPGNGKTTLGIRIADLFQDVVYIPYAVDVGGQIIKVFDNRMHKTTIPEADAVVATPKENAVVEPLVFDERWVPCKRPIAMAGGELTLDMLDLQYDPDTRYYDAPLHMKALNGMLLIDDFGRQRFEPTLLLNRWIVPMENQIDYLKLRSGASFSLPFDELVIFSTNLNPSDLMDPAFLRRIPYKIELRAPTRSEYQEIFRSVASSCGLVVTPAVFDFIVDSLERHIGLAHYQPKFICQQVVDAARAFGCVPELTKKTAMAALCNLYYDIEPPGGDDVRCADAQLISFAQSA